MGQNKRSAETYVRVRDRTLRIEDEERDPLLDLGFKRTKTAPLADQEGLVSVAHKEAPSVTKGDQRKWQIPAAVSNWKNSRGFMVELDKRVEGAGAGREVGTSKGFAELSAALAGAETRVRGELQERAAERLREERELEEEKRRRLDKMVGEITESNDVGTASAAGGAAAASRKDRRTERRKRAAEEMHRQRSTHAKLRELAKTRDVSERVVLGASESLKREEAAFDSTVYLSAAGGGRASSTAGELYDAPLFGAQDALANVYRARRTVKQRAADEEDSAEPSGEAVEFVKEG